MVAIDSTTSCFVCNMVSCSSPTAATNSKTRLVDEGRKRILLIAASIRAGGRSHMAVDINGMTPLFQVFDMATSLKFYCDVLGFQIVTTDANTAPPNPNWV